MRKVVDFAQYAQTKFFEDTFLNGRSRGWNILSRVSERLQRDQCREVNDVYDAEDEKLPKILVNKDTHACDRGRLSLAEICIEAGSMMVRCDT